MRTICVNDGQIHALLGNKIPDMACMMSLALMKSAEHGKMFCENVSAEGNIRTIFWPAGLTLVDIKPKKKIVAFDRDFFAVMDDAVLKDMEAASLILCAFKASVGHTKSFVVDEGDLGFYLADAMLSENLCERICVPSSSMANMLEDDRVVVADTGESYFSDSINRIPSRVRFVSTKRCDAPSSSLDGLCRLAVDQRDGWQRLTDALRVGVKGEEAVIFTYEESMVCRAVAVKMLLDAMEDGNAL